MEKNHGALTHGFCKDKSHSTSLLEFFKYADKEKDKVKPADFIWLFKKPFDRFPRQKLLEKWCHPQILECCCCCVVQLLSHVQLFAIPWTAAYQASWSFTISWSLLKLIFTELMMPSNHLILCPLLPCIQSFPTSGSFLSWLFSNELPKYWSFSFSISPSNECSGLIFYRIDWIDLLAVQRTLRSLLQHHSSKATLLQR